MRYRNELLFTLCCMLFADSAIAADPAVAVIPGYQRFRDGQLTSADAGRLLISELNCHSCHGRLAEESIAPRRAPILTDAGRRISVDHLRNFIAHPQQTKPGTVMPGLRQLSEGPSAEESVAALTSFLAKDSVFRQSPVGADAVRRGEALFHSVGCAACHADLRKATDQQVEFAVPLGNLTTKYSVGSLNDFLANPHAVRPSGRMPSLNLSPQESRDIASYLLKDVDVEANIQFEYYEGSWERLPDFSAMTPVSTGGATDFSVDVSARRDAFALRFTGFLHVPKDAEYRFWLSSDDGSRLQIDGRTVIDHDGVHAANTKTERVSLSAGPHELVLEYFENYGEESLSLEIAGGELSRQPAAGLMARTSDPLPETDDRQKTNPALADKGRQLFADLGCAACHQHGEQDQQIKWTGKAAAFDELNPSAGCLSNAPTGSAPVFALSERQRQDIRAAIAADKAVANAKSSASEATADETSHARAAADIHQALLTLNCYACHQRKEVGGVPQALNELFFGSIPEMGDEGRIPPHLDGVGDKLNPDWLRHVLHEGAKDRPYMATRMPKFGAGNIGELVNQLVAVDQLTTVDAVQFSEPEHRVKAEARLMVGDQALSCIKCHSFDPFKATGIQAMDLTTMTRRLRRDWFHRYLLNPQTFRPGTRMPAAWPNGKSVVPKILDGTPAIQIEAIWVYLADGKQARVPSGLQTKSIELKPVDQPIIYRNFLEGLSPRGIAVGYPEKAHLAYDAEHMTVRMIWHGAFIDASKHWEGRGPGNQGPLGDHVMFLPAGPPLAVLESDNSSQTWPEGSARDQGFRFLGYRLNTEHQPTFRYRWQGILAEDLMQPQPSDREAGFLRTLKFQAKEPTASTVWFRVAEGQLIVQQDDAWVVDNAIRLTFNTGTPQIRSIEGRTELLVPITFDQSGGYQIQYTIVW